MLWQMFTAWIENDKNALGLILVGAVLGAILSTFWSQKEQPAVILRYKRRKSEFELPDKTVLDHLRELPR